MYARHPCLLRTTSRQPSAHMLAPEKEQKKSQLDEGEYNGARQTPKSLEDLLDTYQASTIGVKVYN